MSAIDDLIDKYAGAAALICEKRSATDLTWHGVLAAFLGELGQLPNVMIMPEIPRGDSHEG